MYPSDLISQMFRLLHEVSSEIVKASPWVLVESTGQYRCPLCGIEYFQRCLLDDPHSHKIECPLNRISYWGETCGYETELLISRAEREDAWLAEVEYKNKDRSEAERALAPQLTQEVLDLVLEMVKTYGWRGDLTEISFFVQWLFQLAGKPEPRWIPYESEEE